MLLSAVFFTLLLAATEPLLEVPPSCDLVAVSPWASAGEGYRAQAMIDGDICAEAHLTLALVSPSGRALYEKDFGGTASVRRFYGVPGPAEMQKELEAWIEQIGDKPARSSALPDWPDGAAVPEMFEPDAGLSVAAWRALRAADRPLFCFDDAPGYQSCVALGADGEIAEIGRRATR